VQTKFGLPTVPKSTVVSSTTIFVKQQFAFLVAGSSSWSCRKLRFSKDNSQSGFSFVVVVYSFVWREMFIGGLNVVFLKNLFPIKF